MRHATLCAGHCSEEAAFARRQCPLRPTSWCADDPPIAFGTLRKMTDVLDRMLGRYLAAIGIPLAATAGCGRASTPAADEHVVIHVPPPDPALAPLATTSGDVDAAAPVDVKKCGPDQLRESFCGFASGSQCPADSSALKDRYLSHTSYYVHLTNPFPLDPAMTEEWTTSVGKPLPRKAPYCCYSSCIPLEVSTTATLGPSPGAPVEGQQCIAMPNAPSRFPAAAAPNCPAAVVLPAFPPGVTAAFLNAMPSGEDPARRPRSWLDERCCYRVYSHGMGVGRALRVDGVPRVAGMRRGSEWSARSTSLPAEVPPHVRSRLARHWQEMAALEHASVAAFARLSLILLAHGAPADLIERTHAAALDEIEHARIAYHFASSYGGERIAPAMLDAGSLTTPSLEELAIETLIDGCIEESAAAEWARRAAETAVDPVIAAAVGRIAEDEARHAELAWRILAWLVGLEPALAPRLVEALASRSSREDEGRAEPELTAHGVLDQPSTRALREEIVARVVEPCLGAIVRQARGSSRVDLV